MPAINAALNLAFPVRAGENGEPLIWAYHTPISTEVFTANHRIIAATNASMWGKGLKYAATAGVRIANLTLLDISKADAEEWGVADSGPSFLAELKRLTFILAPGPNGFDMVQVDAALQRNIIDAEDWSEAEAEIVFFTSGYAMAKKAGRRTFCELVASVIGGSITSLPPLEFLASLPTSTTAETSPEAAPSSVPS